jgi:hypothetical protein
MEIIEQFKAYNQSNDEGDRLFLFFACMKRFNNHTDIKLDLKRQIERYFDYKWEVDKNMIINSPEYANFFT